MTQSIHAAATRRAAGTLAGFALMALLLTGCSPGAGEVSGTVMYKGKAITSGQVAMIGSDNLPKYGVIKEDGSYTVTGVAAGEVKVGVSSPNPTGGQAKRPGGERPGGKKDEPAGRGDTPLQYTDTQKATWRALPDKYGDPLASGIKISITAGRNEGKTITVPD